jgi:hypothetical protein
VFLVVSSDKLFVTAVFSFGFDREYGFFVAFSLFRIDMQFGKIIYGRLDMFGLAINSMSLEKKSRR